MRWDGSEGVARLAVPTLVLGGTLDIVTNLEASEVIASRVPHARLQVVDGVNHMGPVEWSETYNQAVGEFAGA